MSRDATDEARRGAEPPVQERRSSSSLDVLLGLIETVRPRQWVKNGLVFAAPLAAGAIADTEVMGRASIAFVAFVMAASGTYLLNDVQDRHSDALHPVKRSRPIAAGRVPVPLAVGASVTLIAGSVVVASWTGNGGVAAVIATYVAATTAYSLGLKRVPLVELVIVGSGFVLRPLAGALAADVPISQWFLIVTSFAALYLVATKRFAEVRDHEGDATRRVLAAYTSDVLNEIRFTTAAVTIVGYVLWAFDNAEVRGSGLWFELSIVPFVMAIYRYAMAVHGGEGEAPEEILLRDPQLLTLGATWLLLYGAGVYAG